MLALPRSEGFWTLETDACDEEAGCMLMHDQLDRAKKPLWY